MRRSKLARVSLVAPPVGEVDVAIASREHPNVAIGLVETADPRDSVIDADAWATSDGFAEFDHAVVRDARSDGLVLLGQGADLCKTTREVLTRYQRFEQRRNEASSAVKFDAALVTHAALHDVTRPLVAVDYDHALDTWQWLLRLEPNAALAVQLAALFHDVERLESDYDRRVERFSAEYRAFKERHATRGAALAARVLETTGYGYRTCARVAEIISSRERKHDPDATLLDDADALSFFSLGSDGYADYFGPEQARRKVASKLSRLSPRARTYLDGVRLRSDVVDWMKQAA